MLEEHFRAKQLLQPEQIYRLLTSCPCASTKHCCFISFYGFQIPFFKSRASEEAVMGSSSTEQKDCQLETELCMTSRKALLLRSDSIEKARKLRMTFLAFSTANQRAANGWKNDNSMSAWLLSDDQLKQDQSFNAHLLSGKKERVIQNVHFVSTNGSGFELILKGMNRLTLWKMIWNSSLLCSEAWKNQHLDCFNAMYFLRIVFRI